MARDRDDGGRFIRLEYDEVAELYGPGVAWDRIMRDASSRDEERRERAHPDNWAADLADEYGEDFGFGVHDLYEAFYGYAPSPFW